MILNSIYADKGKVFGLSLAMICLFSAGLLIRKLKAKLYQNHSCILF